MKEAPAPETSVLTRSPDAAAVEASAENAWPGAGLSDEQAVVNKAVDRASRVRRAKGAFMGDSEGPGRAWTGCRHEMMFLLQPYDAAVPTTGNGLIPRATRSCRSGFSRDCRCRCVDPEPVVAPEAAPTDGGGAKKKRARRPAKKIAEGERQADQ